MSVDGLETERKFDFNTHCKRYDVFSGQCSVYVKYICSLRANKFQWFCPSRTEVIVYVVERSPNGTSRRVPSSSLQAYFEQANVKVNLQQMGVALTMARVQLSPSQIKQLLQNPPAGKESCNVHVNYFL